jgi:hypothetical protein
METLAEKIKTRKGTGIFIFVTVHRRGRRERREIKGKGKLLHNLTYRKFKLRPERPTGYSGG